MEKASQLVGQRLGGVTFLGLVREGLRENGLEVGRQAIFIVFIDAGIDFDDLAEVRRAVPRESRRDAAHEQVEEYRDELIDIGRSIDRSELALREGVELFGAEVKGLGTLDSFFGGDSR